MPVTKARWAAFCLACLLLLVRATAPVMTQAPARFQEGLVHGFLKVSTLNGAPLADGDLVQTAEGARVTSRLTFRFKDGSLHDETTVFTQDHTLRLVNYHLVQRGAMFPRPLDMTIDARTGDVVVRYSEDGATKVERTRLDLKPDIANGLILAILKNARAGAAPTSFSYVAATPKPQLVTLQISSAGEVPFATGAMSRNAVHYVIKVHIGGVTGLLADVFGKAPPDSHVWILGGDAPAFVKSEQTFYVGGPIWRLELVSPEWR